MSTQTEGHSHEYIVKEDDELAATIHIDFYPYKKGVSVSVQLEAGVRMETLPLLFRGLTNSLQRFVDGEVLVDWELSALEDEELGPKDLPF